MAKCRVMFVYWGRRGALPQFMLEVARAALADESLAVTISVSRQNELISSFEKLGCALWTIDTFSRNFNALFGLWRIPFLRRKFYQRLKTDHTELVIELIPHVWSFLLMPMVRKAGARYCTVVHDADAHPGDRSAIVKRILDHVLPQADLVFTLSDAVAARLRVSDLVPVSKIYTVQHPDLSYVPSRPRRSRTPDDPMRLLFLGRIMTYKGLNVFVDAVEKLHDEGFRIEVGVFGEGQLGDEAERLKMIGAEVVNRWLTSDEISDVLARYDLVVLSHTEASQSGVAAAAFGAGVPVVATPVGGLTEQVVDGVTGILAQRVDSDALAEAVKHVILRPEVYREICSNLERTRGDRSMARFVEDIVSHGKHLC